MIGACCDASLGILRVKMMAAGIYIPHNSNYKHSVARCSSKRKLRAPIVRSKHPHIVITDAG